jgi:hypothetical protein
MPWQSKGKMRREKVTHLSDETLMAYADGQLAPVEMARIERLVASDPELRARLEVFRTTGHDLAALFDDHLNAPLPPRLKRFTLAPQADLSKVFDLGAKRKGRILPGVGDLRLAAASAAFLAAGIGIGWLMGGSPNRGSADLCKLVKLTNDRIIALHPLQLALDSLPSGREAAIPISEGRTSKMAVQLSFMDHSQNYCRRYEIGLASGQHYGGIACHLDGEWKIELHAILPPLHTQPGKISLAGSENRALEAAVIAVMDGDALGKEDEEAIIRKGWKKN